MSGYSRSAGLSAYQSVAAHGGVAASDPHGLVTMLLDGALQRLASAKGAIEHGALDSKSRLIHRVVEIIDELRASLNLEAGGEIAANMADLYDYSSRLLLRATLENRTDLLDEVSHLLREIRSAWIQIPSQLGQKS
jgi:flagellar secretion chaperone FliS